MTRRSVRSNGMLSGENAGLVKECRRFEREALLMERVLIEPVLLTENPFRPFPTDLPAAPVKEDFSAFNRVMKEPSSLAENRFH